MTVNSKGVISWANPVLGTDSVTVTDANGLTATVNVPVSITAK